MKGMRWGKRSWWKSPGFFQARKNEAGYVLTWVLILALVSGLIIGPFLAFMLNGLRASHSYADTMVEFYAADSGIEDAIYKILTKDANLPEDAGDSWPYTITDNINGKQVEVTIKNLWILDGLESDTNGTLPHQELVVVGQVLDTAATVLTADIDDDDTTIPVLSTGLFPTASGDDPSIIRIENELIQYTGKTDTQLTGCTRGVNGTTAAAHDIDTTVTSEEVTYRIEISYDNSKGNLKIRKVGAWLPASVSYVPGSSNIATELDNPIFDTATTIPVVSTDLFPDSGVIAIEHELIQYTSKTSDTFEDCTRGYNGTTPADYSAGTPVSAEPQQTTHRGSGTALEWFFDLPEGVLFEDLPYEVPPGGEGGFTPSAEFPIKRTITFSFSPAGEPRGAFSWIRTTRDDIYLSWDTSSGTYKITSTATDLSTGTHTTLESYVGTSKLTGRVSQVFGDAWAIGNSLMQDTNGDANGIRDEVLAESSATVSDIPDDASVEAAYLYWSAWKLNPAYDEDDIEDLAKLVDEATFNGTGIHADRVRVLPNKTSAGGPHGWTYSCFKDVTSMLEPAQSADITLSPTTTTESVTITNRYSWSDLDVRITVLSGPAGGYVTVGGETVMVGDSLNRGYWDSVELTSGDVAGPPDYEVRVEVTSWWDYGTVDGTWIGGGGPPYPNSTDVTLTTTQSPPEATITKITTNAEVDITNDTPDIPPDDPDNNITVDGTTLEPGETLEDHWYSGAHPSDTISGAADDRDYDVTITCTDGMVKVEYGSNSVVLGELGTRMTNGDYTVGNIEGITDEDTGDQWSYAGWSLIIIYSSLSEDAHQLYLYDNFLYAHNDTEHTFTVTGFLAPDNFEGRLTCFVGEGDDCWNGDYIEVNGNRLPHSGDPYDGINPQTDVWNGKSSSLAGEFIDGVDIDTFEITDTDEDVDEGDTSAVVHMGTQSDSWNLVYLFLSFRTDIVPESGQTPVGIITYSSGGG